MKFGEHIRRQRDQDTQWESHYLNYNDLKALLETVAADHRCDDDDDGEKENAGPLVTSSQSQMKAKVVSEEFSRQLYFEMERITLFVYEQQGQIAANLSSIRRSQLNQHEQATSSSSSPIIVTGITTTNQKAAAGDFFIDKAVGDDRLGAIQDRPTSQFTTSTAGSGEYNTLPLTLTDAVSELFQRYCEVGRAILHLYRFVDVNVTGIRKILKKHDKLISARGTPLAEQFLTPPQTYLIMKRLENSIHGSPRSPGIQLSQHRNFALSGSLVIQPLLNQEYFGALVVSLELGLQILQQQEMESNGTFYNDRQKKPLPLESFKSRSFNELANLRWSPRMPEEKSRHSSASLATTFLPGHSEVDVMLSQLRAAQRRLLQTSHFVHFLAAPMMMVTRQGSSDYEDYDNASAPPPPDTTIDLEQSRISNCLNLLSTVLFMTNYYIVAPTSANYAHLLGGNAALASLIIGMTPLAALVSTVLYSWWTSYSYKHALIFASVCSTIGNLFYAAGLPCNSMTMILVGRLLNGFGSARSINRRYIADTYSREDRTAASAAFVTAGAMGMAAGPLLASLLHIVVVRLPNNDGNLYLQSENAPGWFMFCVWATFLVCLIVYFEDPPRNLESAATSSKTKAKETETSPLLINKEVGAKHHKPTPSDEKQSTLWTNGPVMITLFIYVVLKFQNEAVLSAAANLSKLYFEWSPSVVGLYLAGLGFMMIPANLVIGYFARRHEDRDLIIGLLVIMVFGGGLMLDYGSLFPYTMSQYIVASFLLFVASTALEGPNMSLLSKSIPAEWSQGVFNVGLLATESGTFGRTIADALLTLFGSYGLEHLLNRTFVACTLSSIGAVAVCCTYFRHLRPVERDE